MTRVGHAVPDVAAPAAKVFRISADPGAAIDRDRNGSQAELRHSAWAPVSAPGGRSGCSSAEPYPPPRPFFSLRPSCLPPNLLHRATGQQPDCLAPSGTGNRVERGSAPPRPATPSAAIAYPSSPRHPAKPKSTVPFPLILDQRNGNDPSAQSIEPLPSRGRSAQPASTL